MEELTKKESEVIDLVLKGEDRIDAVERVFNCKNRNSARVYASRLYKKPKVMKRLIEISEKVADKLSEETKDFVGLIKKYISMDELAQILVKGVRSNDKRVSDSCMEKLLRIISAYPKDEVQALDGANFQIVMVGGKKENGVKTIEGKAEDLPILMESAQESNPDNQDVQENI